MLSVEAASAEEEEDAERLVQLSLAAITNLTFYGDTKAALRFYTAGFFATVKKKVKHWSSKTFNNFLQAATNIVFELPVAVDQFVGTDFIKFSSSHESNGAVANSLAWSLRTLISLSQEEASLVNLALVSLPFSLNYLHRFLK